MGKGLPRALSPAMEKRPRLAGRVSSVAGFGGGVLTALYMARKDLSANMLAHLLTDGVGLIL